MSGGEAVGVLGLLGRWWLTGAAWARLWPRPANPSDDPAWIAGLVALVRHVLLGAVLNGLLFGGLAAAGVGTSCVEAAADAGLIAAGWLWRRRGAPGSGMPMTPAECGWLAALALGWLALARAPGRGEWIAGGWDPGIYIMQGADLAGRGAWTRDRDPFFGALPDADLPLFTRPTFNYLEGYPVVPLHPERRSLEPFFFPWLPLTIAQFHRWGGLGQAVRVNEFMGLLGILAWMAAVWHLTRSRFAVLTAGVLLLTHPLWTYHMHFPTTEIVQAGLLAGLLLAWAGEPAATASTQAQPPPWRYAAALFLLALTLNRPAFLPFGALLIALDAVRQPHARDRWLLGAGLVTGFALDRAAVPITVGRLGGAFSLLATVAGIGFTLTALLRRRPAWVTGLARALPWGLSLLVTVTAAVFTLLAWRGERLSETVYAMGWSAALLRHFGGLPLLLAALAGLVWPPLRAGADIWRDGRSALAFLAVAAAGVTVMVEISWIAPWAARRHVEFALPVLILGAAGLGARLWAMARPGARALALALAIGLVAAQAREGARAWRATEFDGLTATLESVAAQIAPDDIVIADHFRWATPLRLLFGRTVLNGEIWCTPEGRARFMPALDRLRARAAAQGRRVRILTSTEARLEVFSAPLSAGLDWTAPVWRMREVVQSRRAKRIETRAKDKTFRLYTLAP